jgi:hypothetical protein
VTIDFGSLIAVKVVAAQAPQRGKCLLHFPQLIGRQKRRQNYRPLVANSEANASTKPCARFVRERFQDEYRFL